MLQQYEGLKREIRDLRGKDNIQVIKKCLIYLSKLHKMKDVNTSEEKLFCYHDLALASKRLGKFQDAIRYELIAINYIVNKEEYRYYACLWLLSECYGETNNTGKALELNRECLKYFKHEKYEQERICVLFNKARLLKNTRAMLKIIHVYEKANQLNFNETYGGVDNALIKMYTELQNLFIVIGRNEDYLKILYNVNNKKIKKELYKRYENKVA